MNQRVRDEPGDVDPAAPRVYPVDRSQPQRQQDVQPTPEEEPPVRPQDPPSVFYSR